LPQSASVATRVDRFLPQGDRILVNEQALGRAADAGAPGLGVQHHLERFVAVGRLVDIDMHDAFEMGEDRHPRLALHKTHQPLAAARYDHVDILRHGQQFAYCRPVAGGNQLDRIRGQVCRPQPFDQAGMDRRRGVEAFRTAAQDHRIASLEAERARIRRDVGTAFVDHPDHAERRAHPFDVQPRGPVPFRHDLAHRVGKFRHRPKPVHHAQDAALVQHQPVEHRR
jgi:hypothetical protein